MFSNYKRFREDPVRYLERIDYYIDFLPPLHNYFAAIVADWGFQDSSIINHIIGPQGSQMNEAIKKTAANNSNFSKWFDSQLRLADEEKQRLIETHVFDGTLEEFFEREDTTHLKKDIAFVIAAIVHYGLSDSNFKSSTKGPRGEEANSFILKAFNSKEEYFSEEEFKEFLKEVLATYPIQEEDEVLENTIDSEVEETPSVNNTFEEENAGEIPSTEETPEKRTLEEILNDPNL